MTESIKLTLEPHSDIELNFVRGPLEAFLTLPEAGINEDTGIIMVVGGFDDLAGSDYQAKELRPYLADKFNCIAVGVNYFGSIRNQAIRITPDFLHNINRIYNLEMSLESFNKSQSEEEIYRVIAENIVPRGVTSLDMRCQPTIVTGKEEYQSWGLLPAIDCLQVLGEVLQRYPVNSRRIIAYGKGYGAYIAMLLGKFAPQTFSIIVDRDGYSRSELKHIACGEVLEADYVYAFNIRFSELRFTIGSGSNNPWTIEDELSPFYFSDSHRKIRSLLEEKQRMASDTRYYVFHSEEGLASLGDKDRCVEILSRYNKVCYNRFPLNNLAESKEAQQFQAESYQKAADKDIFAWLAEVDGLTMAKVNENTDFSLNSQYEFDCGEKKYHFEFNDEYRLKVSIV